MFEALLSVVLAPMCVVLACCACTINFTMHYSNINRALNTLCYYFHHHTSSHIITYHLNTDMYDSDEEHGIELPGPWSSNRYRVYLIDFTVCYVGVDYHGI